MGDLSPMPSVDDVAGEGKVAFRVLCHELRQPLGVAMGYVSMLEDGSFGDLPEEARRILITVVSRLEALNELIERGLTRQDDHPDVATSEAAR